MAKKESFAYESKKYNTYKSERKKITNRKVGAGYFNYLYPNNASKARALAYRTRYDDEDDIDYLFGDMEESFKFDLFNLGLYLQSIAADLTDMYVRAFRLMLQNLKKKPKEDESEFAEAFDEKSYHKNEQQSYKTGFKTGKRYKRFDLSFSKDKKGQSEIEKSQSTKPVERKTAKTIDLGAKRSADLGMRESANALKGRGGSKSKDWDDSGSFDTFFENGAGGFYEKF